MSHQKVLELAKKFAEKSLVEQTQNLEEFGYDFSSKLRAILNEMAGDLLTLKVKGYNRSQWKQLSNLYQRLIDMRKDFDHYRPYASVDKIINFVFSKDVLDILQSQNFSIQKFLKENEVDFKSSARLSQARVDSIKNLISLLRTAKDYMQKNPLEITPSEMATIAPPKMKSPEPEYSPVPSEGTTKVGE